jgi:hypothetical protein
MHIILVAPMNTSATNDSPSFLVESKKEIVIQKQQKKFAKAKS